MRKIGGPRIVLILILAVSVVLVANYAINYRNAEEKWKNAVTNNTLSSYANYYLSSLDAEYSDIALDNIYRLLSKSIDIFSDEEVTLWKNAIENYNIDLFIEYKHRFPEGHFIDNANHYILNDKFIRTADYGCTRITENINFENTKARISLSEELSSILGKLHMLPQCDNNEEPKTKINIEAMITAHGANYMICRKKSFGDDCIFSSDGESRYLITAASINGKITISIVGFEPISYELDISNDPVKGFQTIHPNQTIQDDDPRLYHLVHDNFIPLMGEILTKIYGPHHFLRSYNYGPQNSYNYVDISELLTDMDLNSLMFSIVDELKVEGSKGRGKYKYISLLKNIRSDYVSASLCRELFHSRAQFLDGNKRYSMRGLKEHIEILASEPINGRIAEKCIRAYAEAEQRRKNG